MKRKRATIYDVAKMAGVSISTISQVFNNSTSISAKTANNVRTAAERLNYKPRRKKKDGAMRKLGTIAFLTSKPSAVFGSPIYTRLLEHLEDITRRNAGELLVRFDANVDGLDVDGIFYLGQYIPSLDRILKRTPSVKIMGASDPSFPCDIVTDFKQHRAVVIADYFAQKECRKVFVVSGQGADVPDIPNSTSLVYPFRIYRGDNFIVDYGQVRDCVRDVLQQCKNCTKAGIFCVDDAILTHLHWELQQACLEDPQLHDRLELLCQNYAKSQGLLDPAPAFLHIHEDEIIRAAFDQLLFRIDNPTSAKKVIQIVPTIVAPGNTLEQAPE